MRSGDRPDDDIELMLSRYAIDAHHDECRAVAVDALSGAEGEVDRAVISAYRALEGRFDFVPF